MKPNIVKKSRKKIMDISVDTINYDLVFTQIIHTHNNNKIELYYDNYGRLFNTDYKLVGIYTSTKLYLFDSSDIKLYSKLSYTINDYIN